MAEEFDQQVYDDLIAQGKSERVAKAKAKAAAVRKQKQEQAAEQDEHDPDRRRGGHGGLVGRPGHRASNGARPV
jgi:ribosomal protein L12E/L44/L45/RPP1/RPP2